MIKKERMGEKGSRRKQKKQPEKKPQPLSGSKRSPGTLPGISRDNKQEKKSRGEMETQQFDSIDCLPAPVGKKFMNRPSAGMREEGADGP